VWPRPDRPTSDAALRPGRHERLLAPRSLSPGAAPGAKKQGAALLVSVDKIVGDNAHWSLEPIPPDGGFFQITDSPWLTALGLTETNDQQIPHHYVICCKRELIEVAAFHT